MSVLPERRRFTVVEYERMVDAGILTRNDRVELIEGEIVEMTPVNPPHLGTTNRTTRLLVTRFAGRAVVQPAGPIRLFPDSMPEPDFALLVDRADFYSTVLPQPSDVYLAIEVSDTSLSYDRGRKLQLYARHGIREYWIVDITQAQIIVARSPGPDGYAEVVTVPRDGEVSPEAFPDVVLAARDILG